MAITLVPGHTSSQRMKDRADQMKNEFGARSRRALVSAPVVALALATTLAALLPVAAQDWPAKQVKVVVPFGPGSTPDMVARLLADLLQHKHGVPFVVENKPGASGNTGTDAVAKAEPDGATIGIS